MQNKVFLVGVFDMIHRGHVNLLQKAAALGHLTVGVVCDEAIKKEKGEWRPIISQNDRAFMVGNIKGVESVILLDDFEIPLFFLQEADIIVVGEDQSHIKNLNQINPNKRFDIARTEGVSTSDIIKKIKDTVYK